jgi:hypothetical protein
MVANTKPTGQLVVLGVDPASTVLKDKYDAIVREHVTKDPQEVPDVILERTHAVNAEQLLAAPGWAALVELRDAASGAVSPQQVRDLLARDEILRGTTFVDLTTRKKAGLRARLARR